MCGYLENLASFVRLLNNQSGSCYCTRARVISWFVYLWKNREMVVIYDDYFTLHPLHSLEKLVHGLGIKVR